MLTHTILATIAALAVATPTNLEQRDTCTALSRIYYANQVLAGYNEKDPIKAAAIFQALPVTPDCQTYFTPNNGPALLVGPSGEITKAFATLTSQILISAEGTVTDNADNYTTIIDGPNHVGVGHIIPVPVVFNSQTILFYNLECQIKFIHAYVTLPTELLGFPFTLPNLPSVPFNPDPSGPPTD